MTSCHQIVLSRIVHSLGLCPFCVFAGVGQTYPVATGLDLSAPAGRLPVIHMGGRCHCWEKNTGWLIAGLKYSGITWGGGTGECGGMASTCDRGCDREDLSVDSWRFCCRKAKLRLESCSGYCAVGQKRFRPRGWAPHTLGRDGCR